MKKPFPSKRDILITSTISSSMILMPTALANTATYSPPIILKLISKLLTVFWYAGLVLLVYAVIALILALKNEDAESKVNAVTQISIAIVLITLSGTVNTLLAAAGVSGTV